MAEAAILALIQDLESFDAEEEIEELREILDFMSDWKMEEKMRLRYLMNDLVGLVQAVMNRRIGFHHLNDEIKGIKVRMINFGANQENVGEEEAGEEVVVGLEADVKRLVNKAILGKEKSSRILCIKGMIGIGKTTLARQIYNHKDVVGRFQRRGWVRFSSDKSDKEILMELMQQLEGVNERDPSLEEMDNESLRQMLYQRLEGMSYLIVLDNLPNDIRLHLMTTALPREGEDHGSRLLFTTSYRVNIMSSRPHFTHEMKALDPDKSWQLFLKKIHKFTCDENKFSKDLERKGKEMLKKCGGLPIAIIDVARQKAKQRLSGIEWEQLFDSIDLSGTLKRLEPMYHNLEQELRPCFMRMSFSKENALIRREKMEHIWAASGFNSGIHTTSSFADKSFIEAVNEPCTDFLIEIGKYRLNPLLHMLSIKKAEEEIGFEILRSNGYSQPSQNIRHRVIHCGREKFNHSTNQDSKHLISLIFHGGGRYLDDANQSYWKSFELLKILDMEDFGVKTLSETMSANALRMSTQCFKNVNPLFILTFYIYYIDVFYIVC